MQRGRPLGRGRRSEARRLDPAGSPDSEVSQLDIQMENGKIKAYRAKVKVSFKYEAKK
jgi:Dodecin